MTLADLIGDVMNPPPARGRKAKPVSAVVRRELNEADVQALWDLPEGGLTSETPPLVRLRHQHHYVARLLADGVPGVEVSLITGMSASRISVLQGDPAFSELVKYYKEQAGEAYVNVHERLATLGLGSTEELMDRLLDTPEKFSNRELMELAALGLDRTGHGPTSKVQATVTVLSAEVLDKLKAELASRQNGTVRPLTHSPSRPGLELGQVIDHEPLADAEGSEGSEGKGTDI